MAFNRPRLSRQSRFTRARREVVAIEKLVGRAGLRPLPFHVWHDALVRDGGRPSPEFTAAAEHARRYYAAVTLPSLRP